MTTADNAKFKAKVRASMRQLQNDPEKIRSFYQKHVDRRLGAHHITALQRGLD